MDTYAALSGTIIVQFCHTSFVTIRAETRYRLFRTFSSLERKL